MLHVNGGLRVSQLAGVPLPSWLFAPAHSGVPCLFPCLCLVCASVFHCGWLLPMPFSSCFDGDGSKNMLYPVEDHALRRQTGQRKLTFVCRTCGNKEAMSPETLAKPVYKNVVTHTEKCVVKSMRRGSLRPSIVGSTSRDPPVAVLLFAHLVLRLWSILCWAAMLPPVSLSYLPVLGALRACTPWRITDRLVLFPPPPHLISGPCFFVLVLVCCCRWLRPGFFCHGVHCPQGKDGDDDERDDGPDAVSHLQRTVHQVRRARGCVLSVPLWPE